MPTNYKHQYESCKKMLAMYQDEVVPVLREEIAILKDKLARSQRRADKCPVCGTNLNSPRITAQTLSALEAMGRNAHKEE